MKKILDWFGKPMNTRRLLAVLVTLVALGLVVFVNVQDQELRGSTVLISLLGGGVGLYGASHIFGRNHNNEDL